MSQFLLVVGNKNLSSWSLRPYLVLRQTGVHFTEEVVYLDRPDTSERIRGFSPSGRVPALHHEGQVIWDSLAICEYLHELFPDAQLWPAMRDARAHARSISAEMHAGFQALRTNMPMNLREQRPGKGRADGVDRDIERILAIWRGARASFGHGGPFLFGRFTIADAMFAPVVTRFRTYGVDLDEASTEYTRAVWELPAMQEWAREAAKEP